MGDRRGAVHLDARGHLVCSYLRNSSYRTTTQLGEVTCLDCLTMVLYTDFGIRVPRGRRKVHYLQDGNPYCATGLWWDEGPDTTEYWSEVTCRRCRKRQWVESAKLTGTDQEAEDEQ